MDNPNTRRYEMLVRVSDFGAAHADIFPAESLGGQMFAATKAAARSLGEHAAAQMSSRGAAEEALRAKVAARTRLVTALNVIRRTSRALALDTPGLDSKFGHPGNQGEQALLATARGFSKDAHTVATGLLAHGLPATFLDDLDTAILAFEAAIRDHDTSQATLAAARAGINAALEAGLTAVQRLDAIVPNLLRDDPSTYASWERARHVERPPRARNGARKPAAATPAEPPTATAPIVPKATPTESA